MFPVTDPYSDGWPNYLIAYLVWKDPDPNHFVDMTATITLAWNPTTGTFQGQDPGPGFSLGGSATRLGTTNLWDLTVDLLKNGALDERHEFFAVQMGPDVPWDSGYLALVTTPGLDEQALQMNA